MVVVVLDWNDDGVGDDDDEVVLGRKDLIELWKKILCYVNGNDVIMK